MQVPVGAVVGIMEENNEAASHQFFARDQHATAGRLARHVYVYAAVFVARICGKLVVVVVVVVAKWQDHQ